MHAIQRIMGDEKFLLPDAFSHCSDEAKKCEVKRKDLADSTKEAINCQDAKDDKDKCGKGGCYCELFRRGKGAKHANDKWQLAPLSQDTKDKDAFVADKNDKFDFECLCVKPKLPSNYTLHGCKTCDISFETGDVSCDGTCEGVGRCHLFRIKRPDKDSKGAEEWEHVAWPGEKKKFDKAYYYHCFCVKYS
jgi:hypothetical protein